MTTETTQLPANIVGSFNLALTQSKFQQLQTKADSLVFNEENLNEIQEFLKGLKGVEKAIETTHKTGKAEALQIGRNWDNAKNTFLAQVEAIMQKPKSEYERICREIEQRRLEQERERQRIASIKQGIEQNALNFASRIALAKTSDELTTIERTINLEKSRKEKYQEFLDDAVNRFNQLNSLLAQQKVEVKKLEEIARQELEAQKLQDDAKLIELQEKKEKLESKIEEQKIVVQETAINQSLNDTIEIAEVIYPEIRAKRTTISFEVFDIKETLKKKPEWVELIPNKDAINEHIKELKESSKGDIDIVIDGIRFYTKKTY